MPPKGMSLATKVTILVLIVILINTISIGVFSYIIHRNNSIENNAKKTMAMAKSAAASIIPAEFWQAINQNRKNEHYEHLQKQFNKIKAEENLLYFYAGTFDPDTGMVTYLESFLPDKKPIFGLNGVVPGHIFPQEASDAFNNGKAYATDVYKLNIDGRWGISVYAPIFDENHKPFGLIGVVESVETVLADSYRFALSMLVVSFLFFVVIIWVPILYIRQSVAKPLLSLQIASDKITRGDMNIHMPTRKSKDEIGILSYNFSAMQETVIGIHHEIKDIVENAINGNLNYRAQSGKYTGEWRKVITMFNDLMDTIKRPIDEVADTLHKIADGDFKAHISREYKGDFARMKEAVNSTAVDLDHLLTEKQKAENEVYKAELAKGRAEALNEAYELTKVMLDMSPLGIIFIDENYNDIACNNKILDILGFNHSDEKDVISRFQSFFPEYQRNGEESTSLRHGYIKQAFDEGLSSFEWDFRTRHGEIIPCGVTIIRSAYSKDRVAAIAYIQDLRELKSALSNLRQADERSQLMLDSTPLCINFWDKNFNNIDCNQTAVTFFKLKSKQEYLERFFELSPEFQPDGRISKDKAKEIVLKAVEDGYHRCEWLNQMLDGEPVPCELTLVRVKYHDDFVVVVYTRDLRAYKAFIAEIEKAQENLKNARDAAESANRAKSVFLANISHEIRTPMNSIIGFSELARSGDLPPKTKEYLDHISESAEWLLNIINDLLDVSKIEAGKITLENIPFDLHDVLAHCQSVIRPKTLEKGITLFCYAEPSISGKLLGDPVRLRQVILNLLSNAVKFTNVGTVKLLASIEASFDDKVTINFEVKDSGIGMTSEQITRIFDPFIQADDSVTRRFGGTGLGLTITKNIIDLMGGALKAESAAGVGSKFSFTLTFTLVDDSVDSQYNEIVLNILEKPKFEGLVLVCEDNSLNQQVICDHLSRVGLETVIADNGKEGVDKVEARMKSGEKPFDLIFMDIHMPVMDGLEAASIITGLGVKTPIVAITANIMSNDLELYRKSGMTDCVGKPFTSQQLWKCLIKFLPVSGFSTQNITQVSREKEKLLRRLELNFVKSNQGTVAYIMEAINSGDIKLAHRLAHTLKSTAGQIGKTQLEATAAAVESALTDGKFPLNDEQLSRLDYELRLVLAELAPQLAAAKEGEKAGTVNPDEARELFDELEPLLNNRDTEALDFLDDIRTIKGADKLAHLIEELQFKQAAEAMADLKKTWIE